MEKFDGGISDYNFLKATNSVNQLPVSRDQNQVQVRQEIKLNILHWLTTNSYLVSVHLNKVCIGPERATSMQCWLNAAERVGLFTKAPLS